MRVQRVRVIETSANRAYKADVHVQRAADAAAHAARTAHSAPPSARRKMRNFHLALKNHNRFSLLLPYLQRQQQQRRVPNDEHVDAVRRIKK